MIDIYLLVPCFTALQFYSEVYTYILLMNSDCLDSEVYVSSS